MKLEIINERENPVLQRKELILSLDNEKGPTPKKSDIIDKLSAQLNKDKELLVIQSVDQPYGSDDSKALVKVYNDKAAKDLAEPNQKAAEGEGTSAAPAEGGDSAPAAEGGETPAEAPAEPEAETPTEPAAETPVEEKSEEPKEEPATEGSKKEEKPEGEE